MSICDGCIHDNVCGLEDNHEESIVSCADMIPKDVFDKIRAEIGKVYEELDDYDPHSLGTFVSRIDEIFDKYKAESEYKERLKQSY